MTITNYDSKGKQPIPPTLFDVSLKLDQLSKNVADEETPFDKSARINARFSSQNKDLIYAKYFKKSV